MIGNLTFDSICEMVLNERVARFQYIKLDPEAQKMLEDELTEKERSFYEVTIPNTVKKGLRIKKVMGATDIDFEEPISEIDPPGVKSAKQLYQERVKMYRDVFLNIKHVINNLPDDPSNPESKVQGLKLNELFSTSVSPAYKVTKLQMNQFKNFISGMTKTTDTIKWSGAIEGFVPGSAEISDVTDAKPIDPLERGPLAVEPNDDVDPGEREIDIPETAEEIGATETEEDDDIDVLLGKGNRHRKFGFEDGDEDEPNALGLDPDIDSAYRHTIGSDIDYMESNY